MGIYTYITVGFGYYVPEGTPITGPQCAVKQNLWIAPLEARLEHRTLDEFCSTEVLMEWLVGRKTVSRDELMRYMRDKWEQEPETELEAFWWGQGPEGICDFSREDLTEQLEIAGSMDEVEAEFARMEAAAGYERTTAPRWYCVKTEWTTF